MRSVNVRLEDDLVDRLHVHARRWGVSLSTIVTLAGELYNRPILQERLAFRRGTALHKLVLAPATRYSEDIDFVYLRLV